MPGVKFSQDFLGMVNNSNNFDCYKVNEPNVIFIPGELTYH